MNTVRTSTTVALTLAVLSLAGCADRHSYSGPAAGTASSPAPAANQLDCAAGRVVVSWNEQQAPTNAICVHVGAEIAINLYPPQQHQWTAPTSSDPTVATVAGSAANQEGAMAATVEARRAGTAAISAVAKAMDGAPDPGSTPWRLVVTVIA